MILCRHEIDGGYGWLIVASSFVIHGLVLGSLFSFGVYYPIYIEVFHASKGEVAWIGSISGALMVGMGLWSGSYADRYGNRVVIFLGSVFVGIGLFLGSFATKLWHLYITQGLLCGVGYSLSYIAGLGVVGQWFQTKRGLAIGISAAGAGLGQFAISQWTAYFISTYNWRICLRFNALIISIGLAFCSSVLIRKVPLNPLASIFASIDRFQSKNFRLLYLANAIFSIGCFMPFTHLPIYAINHGISTSKAVLLLSISGASSAVGRILLGFAADRVGKLVMLQFTVFGAGVTALCWMACTSFSTLLVIAISYGMFSGGFFSTIPLVCAELFGIQSISALIGLLYTANAFGNLISAPLGGMIVDYSGDYKAAIAVTGTCILIASIIYLFVDPSLEVDKEPNVISVNDGKVSNEYEMIDIVGDDVIVTTSATPADVVIASHLNESNCQVQV
jgi:MFS family permease